jgi:hypothetical protein
MIHFFEQMEIPELNRVYHEIKLTQQGDREAMNAESSTVAGLKV